MGTSNSQPSMEGGDGDSPSSGNRSSGLLALLDEASGAGSPLNSVISALRGSPTSRAIPARETLQTLMRDISGWVEDDDDDDVDDDDEEHHDCPSEQSYPYPEVADTTALEESEFSMMTKLASGQKLKKYSEFDQPPPIVKMVAQREMGMKGGSGFTSHDISNATHHFLPNEMTIEDIYHHKAFCGTYSQDGSLFLSACQDRKLRLYKTTGPRFIPIRKIAARDVGWSILDTAFSPDGSCCVYSSWSDSIYLVRLFGDSDCQDTLPLHPTHRRFCIFSLVFSQDGQEILCGANDGFLYVYDRFSNKRILKIDGHHGDVNSVAYADSASQILYSGSDDGLCKVWDRRTLSETDPKPVGVLAGHMDGITFIEPRGDGRHLLSNSKDQTIKLWDVRAFSSESGQEETRRAVANQQWDYRWQKVPTKLKHSQARLSGDTSIMTYRGHSVLQTLIRCHFSPSASTGQRYIYTGCAQGKILIYDALTGAIINVLLGHRACVRDVSWHPYKPELTSTSWDAMVARWRYREEENSSDEDGDDIADRVEFSDSSGSSQPTWVRRVLSSSNSNNRANCTFRSLRPKVKRSRDH